MPSQVRVSWLPPDSSRGDSIIGYQVQLGDPASDSCQTNTELSCVFTETGTRSAYVLVRARTLTGFGAWAVAKVSSVNILDLVIEDGAVKVIWYVQDVGLVPDTAVSIFTEPESAGCRASYGVGQCRVEGLENGTEYEFRAKSFGVFGTSLESDALSAIPLGLTKRASGTTRSLTAVAWNGQRLVAVGETGTILVSTDGTSWAAQISGFQGDLHGVVWDAPIWIAVGDSGMILTSPDGTVWTPRASGTSERLRAVASNGQVAVAVGDSGTVLRSLDGQAWDLNVSGTGADLYALTWASSRWVAVGAHSATLTSSDGEIWAIRAIDLDTAIPPTIVPVLYSVLWTGEQLLSAGTTVGRESGPPWGPDQQPYLQYSSLSGVHAFSETSSSWFLNAYQSRGVNVLLEWNAGFLGLPVKVWQGGGSQKWFPAPGLAGTRAGVSTDTRLVLVGDEGLILTSPLTQVSE